MNLQTPFLLYLLIINALGFGSMLVDKYKAKKKKWRIPERTLLLFALLGGSAGSFLGMHLFHHKTRKLKFSLGVPLILVLQLVLGIFLYTRLGAQLLML